MADATTATPQVCSRFHRAIELIGSRWTGAILQTLLQGRTRYAVIKGAIPDITDRMLSERLRSLEAEDLVVRTVVPESPVRVEYDLTPKGRELQAALREIGNWAERWIPLESDDSQDVPRERKGEKHLTAPPASPRSHTARPRVRPRTA
jgi:DNA-binding HxlR family transcriptional regulator